MLSEIIFLTAFMWLLLGAGSTILSFISFDRLLRQIRDESEAVWIDLGKPIGFFWVPPGTTGIAGPGFVRGELYRRWSSHHGVPEIGNKELLAKLRFLKRLGSLGFIVGVFQLICGAAILFAG